MGKGIVLLPEVLLVCEGESGGVIRLSRSRPLARPGDADRRGLPDDRKRRHLAG